MERTAAEADADGRRQRSRIGWSDQDAFDADRAGGGCRGDAAVRLRRRPGPRGASVRRRARGHRRRRLRRRWVVRGAALEASLAQELRRVEDSRAKQQQQQQQQQEHEHRQVLHRRRGSSSSSNSSSHGGGVCRAVRGVRVGSFRGGVVGRGRLRVPHRRRTGRRLPVAPPRRTGPLPTRSCGTSRTRRAPEPRHVKQARAYWLEKLGAFSFFFSLLTSDSRAESRVGRVSSRGSTPGLNSTCISYG